jgi:hypothetical protein
MKKKFSLLSALLVLLLFSVGAQTDTASLDRATFGVGFGLDYGGLGANLTLYPAKNLGLFAGAGYALADAGYNVGVKIRLFSPHNPPKLQFSILGMYGYNTAVKIFNAEELSKLFFGPTIGAGLDLKLKKQSSGYFSFGLFIPIRNEEVSEYIDYLKYDRGVDFSMELLPFAVSAGYRFIIS